MNATDSRITAIAVHEIGDRSLQQDLVLSQRLLNPDSEELELLKDFFLGYFKAQEFYTFRIANPSVPVSRLYHPVSRIFEDPSTLLAGSGEIARQLYIFTETELLTHGYLFVCYFKDVMIADELTDAIGLYYSHSDDWFLTPENIYSQPLLRFSQGIFTGKHEMACLIYDTDAEAGYKIDVIDKSKKSNDGPFWKELFLQVNPAEDDFFRTSHLMGLTKSFVDHQLPMEFAVEKKEQLDYLNRSIDYFKTQDHYSEQDFAGQIFDDVEIARSFGDFRQSYEDTHEIDLPAEFDLNEHAVKKQARHFKSVLKLDRNFHVYIHGDRSLIERGIDEQGRKFYKLYFENEL